MRNIVVGFVSFVFVQCALANLDAQVNLGTTSDPNVNFVSASNDAAEGTYSIFIDQPATKGIIVSEPLFSPLASNETLTINGVNVTLAIGMSIQQIRDRVNEFSSQSQVEAVIRDGLNSELTLAAVEFGGDVSVIATGVDAGIHNNFTV